VDQDGFLVVYKPHGWTATTTSNRGDQRRKIQSWILETYGEVYPYLLSDPLQAGIVHRLDIQTTGPMVVATCPETFRELCYSIGRLTWYKEYLALVHGAIPSKMSKGRLTYRLHVPKMWGQRLWRTEVSNKGLLAETQFQALRVYKREVKGLKAPRFYTLVRIRLITGRTHQIRVHFREFARRLGFDVCGLVGDHIYLPRNQLVEDQTFCERIFLHERRLEFPHPDQDKEGIRILCTLPPDLMKALSRCEVHQKFAWREFSGKVPPPTKPRVSLDEFGEVVVNRPPSPWRPPKED
jgi:23S rRNA pseudouridine1911/1915/1917 synthase